MIIRLSLVALLYAASAGCADASEHPARATRNAAEQIVTNSAPAWRNPRPAADEVLPRARAGTPIRPATEPSVQRQRAFHRAPAVLAPEVKTAPLRGRLEPAADELSVRTPGPAAGVELVPDEAETNCMRTEGQMRCTPLYE